MAYSKIILNGETLMDVTSDTVDAGNLLSGKTATKNDGTKVTGNISTVTHPNPTGSFTSTTGVFTAKHIQSTGYVTGGTTSSTYPLVTQNAQTFYPSTADQTVSSYRWLIGSQTIKSVTTSNLTASNIAEGVTVKVGDATNASRITQVTGTHSGATSYTASISGDGNSSYCYVTHNGTKYYSNGSTFSFKAGDTLTVYCRGNYFELNGEQVSLTNYSYTYTLPIGDIFITINYISSTNNDIGMWTYVAPSGNITISSAGPTNVYSYAGAIVAAGNAFPPAVTITKAPTIGVNVSGVITASYNGSSSITPTVNAGYITTGTAGTISTTGTSTYQLTSQAAATYYPSTADQTIASYRWLTGAQTIKSVTTSNLTAANIASGVTVKVGDANNASRITQITGTYAGDTSWEDAIVQRNLYSFQTYENSRVNKIGQYAFASVMYLKSIYIPNVSIISSNAFYNTQYMVYISAPQVSSLGIEAFFGCKNLSSVSFSLVTEIPSSCFQECSKLQSVFFPNVTLINTDAFHDCSSLTNIYMPNLQSCGYGDYYFRSCTNLSSVNFPNLYSVGSAMFNWCINLHTVSLGNSTITSARFNASVFMVCRNLLSLYLYYGAVPEFGSSMFYGSPISDYTTSTGGVYGSIFVPSSLYNSYITATGWAAYSARMVSI